jgi:transposase-like protein
LALGINIEGEKELLSLWIAETESSKFWLFVFNDIKNRGVHDCFIACVDGVKGLPEAIKTVYPDTQIQLCIITNCVILSNTYRGKTARLSPGICGLFMVLLL